MRIGLCSDLHLEGRAQDFTIPDDLDVLFIAGDIHVGLAGMEWAATLKQKCIIYPFGNHEYYHHDFNRLNKLAEATALDMRESDKSQIYVAGPEPKTLSLGDKKIIYCTLWTDYMFNGEENQDICMLLSAKALNDHRIIQVGDRLFTTEDALQYNQIAKNYIMDAVKEHGRENCIVVTHHSPSGININPKFAGDMLNGAFHNDWSEWINDNGPALWCYGHTHWDVDFTLGDTRIVSRQRGYRRERAANGQDEFEVAVIEI